MKTEKSRAEKKKKGEKRKHQNDMQSEAMLKLRAALEGKLIRSNGVFLGSTVSKSDKALKRQKRNLAGAGVKAEESEEDKDGESEDEFYKQVKQKQEAIRAAKAEIYSRKPQLMPSLPETVDGKRLISYQIDKNRGLTRQRNRDRKNPIKNYRNKYSKKAEARKGQVRDIRTQTGPYAGETRGINPNTSRSIRIKN